MAEASRIGIFNSKVSSFNKAVQEQDYDNMSKIFGEMLQFALDECAKPNVTQTIKETYSKQCQNAYLHIQNLAKRAAPPAIKSSSGDSGEDADGDPYYSEKQWFSDEVPNLNFTNIIGVQEVKIGRAHV